MTYKLLKLIQMITNPTYAKIYPQVVDMNSLIQSLKYTWTNGQIKLPSICDTIRKSGYSYNLISHYMIKGSLEEIQDKIGVNLTNKFGCKVFVQLDELTIQLINYKANFFISAQGACEVSLIKIS